MENEKTDQVEVLFDELRTVRVTDVIDGTGFLVSMMMVRPVDTEAPLFPFAVTVT